MSSSTATSISAHLRTSLEQLNSYFTDPSITEISINPDGLLWAERLGDAHMLLQDERLEPRYITRLAQDLASASLQPLSGKTPIASSEFTFSGGQWRVQVVASPIVEGLPSISMRRIVLQNFALSELVSSVQIDPLLANDEVEMCKAMLDEKRFENFFHHIVKHRWNILISGGTGAGKTTWLRSFLAEAEPTDRIITIENAFEINPTQSNSISMRMSENASSQTLLKSAMRMRPDRVILGELRGAEAKDFLAAINSGHPGGISTIHAENSRSAIVKLASYVMEAGTTLTLSDVVTSCKTYIDCIIQINRDKTDGSRKLTEINILRQDLLASQGT